MTSLEEAVWAAVFAREINILGYNTAVMGRECAYTADSAVRVMRKVEEKYSALHPDKDLEKEREERQ